MSVASVRVVVFAAWMAALFSLGITDARAANPAPNGGFESDCSGVPCNWNAVGDTVVFRDTVQKHSGAASIALLDLTDPAQAISDCVGAFGTGSYTVSFWYRTTSSNVTDVTVIANSFSAGNCTAANLVDSVTESSPINDGAWHQVTGTLDLPPGTNSALLSLFFGCGGNCGGTTQAVGFDDLVIDGLQSPTAVWRAKAWARWTPAGVNVSWRTTSEVGLAGFHVWRAASAIGPYTRINRVAISARSSARGFAYRYLDRTVRSGRSYLYKIELLRFDGQSAWTTPALAGRRR